MFEGRPQPAPGLGRISGWLAVFGIVLVPHILLSGLILARSFPVATLARLDGSSLAVERLRVLTEAVILVGHCVGLALMLTRNRFTPAYFTLYIPLLLVLFSMDPNTVATQMAFARRIGFAPLATTGGAAAQAHIRTVLSVAVSAIAWGYWLRSRRVQVVFGSRGLAVLTGAARAAGGNP